MMLSSASTHFPHRVNEDGIVDSICPRCYVTIGSSERESDLEKMELAHVCDPSLVNYYKERDDAAKKQPQGTNPPGRQRRKAV
jgi:hypothetical protein